ncbi:MAG: hypothetical protein A3K04_00555 [Gallionellales bacterium RBG_16_56_9]|nr:MAG: hypothetical protein A3K04_00555 [Gallionellales bacterium RBG_16_56_9]
MGNPTGLFPSPQVSMKTGRFLILAALALTLASFGGNGAGGIAGTEHRWSDAVRPLAAALPPPPVLQFRQEGVCPVPVLNRAIAFKGGATTGEEVTVKLDTARHTYEIRIDTSKTPGRQGMRRRGKLLLDPRDCSYRLSGEATARLAVNKDGVLFGGLDADTEEPEAPAVIVAFKNTSADIVDLSGSWWVFESRNGNAGRRRSAYLVRILPDGQFSQCELDDGAADECRPLIGKLHYNGTAFVSQEENGNVGTLVVGRVAGKLVPILLQQDETGSGMRILAPQRRQAAPAPPTPDARPQLPQGQ